VLIVADDLNTRLGTYGYAVRSPNIDALARRGVQFDRAYVQYPLCNPSRSSLLSGRRPASTGIANNNIPARQAMPDGVFLPQYFRQHGYFTARVGKIFHITRNFAINLDDPLSWDETINERIPDQQALASKVAGERRFFRLPRFEPLEWAPLDVPDNGLGDGYVADRAVDWLQRAAKDDRPFFLAVGFRRPHLPWEAPKQYFDMYPPERIVLPDEPPDDTADIPPVALTTQAADSFHPADRRQAIAAYAASTSYMDAQVGKVVSALDRLGITDRTIIIFMGDHGYHLGEHGGMWEKNSLFEESARFPLVIATPGRPRGTKSPRVVEALDLYPTKERGRPQPGGAPQSGGCSVGQAGRHRADAPAGRWRTADSRAVRANRTLALYRMGRRATGHRALRSRQRPARVQESRVQRTACGYSPASEGAASSRAGA
jgi:uncharacterized sulfatase